ncbi:MAG: response regulator [Anaerolineae bacterium]|nr:response regulator [Anaerolineae bacterium]
MVKILYVEDEPGQRELVKQLLCLIDLDVQCAKDGSEGVKKALIWLPDIILMDLRMPGMNGFEAIKQLREMPETTHIPVIIVSAWSGKIYEERAATLGVAKYLTKPFDLDELLEALETVTTSTELKPHNRYFTADYVASLSKRINNLSDKLYKCEEALNACRNSQEEEGRQTRLFSLAELNRLTDGIMHDMRNGLGVIRNTISFLESDLHETEHQNDLAKISRGVEFCEVLLRNLATLGEADTFHVQRVNLTTIMRSMYSMLERKLVDVELVVDVVHEDEEIMADKGQMEQVFMNLIKNAGDAMPNGGTLTFRTRREGEMLRIELSDTGCGISPENRERLFREFFTTKERGYGLGLHIVYTIVQRHGGTIEVESEVGKGTTFVLHLPIDVGATDD